MKILIMQCESDLWYRNKVAARYIVQAISINGDYITKDGQVKKEDAAVIEK